MRKRKRGLGFSMEEHRGRIADAANNARRSAADAHRALEAGNCGTAIRYLAKAEFALGAVNAHAQSGHASVGAATREAFNSVLDVQDLVAKRCTIAR